MDEGGPRLKQFNVSEQESGGNEYVVLNQAREVQFATKYAAAEHQTLLHFFH